ncbi:MAG: hypothetical protein GY711_27265 [bacterium]|nr:hypothetical protein [bacterium]
MMADGTDVRDASTALAGTRQGLIVAAGFGALVFLIGLMVAPERTWGGYLMGFSYFVGLALAGLLFLAVLYLARGEWAFPLRRVPEAMASTLPVAAVLGLVLIAGIHSLYEWSHSSVVESDPLLTHKSTWLNGFGFSVRLVIYFALWIWLGRRLVRVSRSGDRAAEVRAASWFLLAFALTFSLASIDWVQSLDPHWFSTMFALRMLSGIGLAGLAVCTIVLVTLRRRGAMREVVTRDILDDLGKLLLALSLFWAYIWYCQYMIIWYTDIPEETGYYILRHRGPWAVLVPVNLIVNFAVPFLALMLSAWRRNGVILRRIAVWLLVGHALDLYVMIAPPLATSRPVPGLWEVGPLAGILALFAWSLLGGMQPRKQAAV